MRNIVSHDIIENFAGAVTINCACTVALQHGLGIALQLRPCTPLHSHSKAIMPHIPSITHTCYADHVAYANCVVSSVLGLIPLQSFMRMCRQLLLRSLQSHYQEHTCLSMHTSTHDASELNTPCILGRETDRSEGSR